MFRLLLLHNHNTIVKSILCYSENDALHCANTLEYDTTYHIEQRKRFSTRRRASAVLCHLVVGLVTSE